MLNLFIPLTLGNDVLCQTSYARDALGPNKVLGSLGNVIFSAIFNVFVLVLRSCFKSLYVSGGPFNEEVIPGELKRNRYLIVSIRILEQISSCSIFTGFAYIEYSTPDEAQNAMKHMDGGQIDGQVKCKH